MTKYRYPLAKYVFLTPGTGSYYCGACMRDNNLARELIRNGFDVTVAPLYLPLVLDEEPAPGVTTNPVFFGGINVYLQQKIPFLRRSSPLLDRLLNTNRLLRWVARHSHLTSPRDQGEMTLEMLQGSDRLRKEWDKLLLWLEAEKPDIICLSNALLAGFTRVLKARLPAAVVVFFQGEDSFLDALPEPFREQCWTALKEQLPLADRLIAPSNYYAQYMRERLGLQEYQVCVVPNGIRVKEFPTARGFPVPPMIGYFARMCPEKGLEILVEAFIILATELGDTKTELKIAGAATPADEPFIREMKRRIEWAGLNRRVYWCPNVKRERKLAILRDLTIFSVPAIYPEAFGMYVVEALACGIPVVQPAHASFPEIIEATGGGFCVPPHDAYALAIAWRDLLRTPGRQIRLSRQARTGVLSTYTAPVMCEHFRQVTEEFAPHQPQ